MQNVVKLLHNGALQHTLSTSPWNRNRMSEATTLSEVKLIKKYANRRLYDTSESHYITLPDIRKMVEAKQQFTVIDAKTGADLTRTVLMQVINDYEALTEDAILPISILRQIVQLYGSKFANEFVAFVEENLVQFMGQLDHTDLGDEALLASMRQPLNKELVAQLLGSDPSAPPAVVEQPSTPAVTTEQLSELKDEIKLLQEKLDNFTGSIKPGR